MNGHLVNSYITYALILTLVGSLFSMAVPLQLTSASHSDIEFEISDIVFDANDDVTITGTVAGGDENDQIEITVDEPGSGDENDTVDLDEQGDFDYQYSFPSGADDGVYQVEFVFGSDDPVFGFFILDDVNDDLDVSTDDTYQLGDGVNIDGNVGDDIFDSDIDEVEITIIGPDGTDELASQNVDVENNGDFEYDDYSVDDNEDAHGWYAIIVEYNDEEEGWEIFEVEEDGGSSGDSEISASLSDATLSPGDPVVITGSVSENDLGLQEVILAVEDPDNVEIETDSVRPDTDDGSFEFRFDLDEDAEIGTYEVTLQYEGYDDKTLTFTVSTGSTGGSGGSGGSSGSDGGLTAKLSKSSLLAGETLTVSGVVPSIASGDDGVSITVSTPGNNYIAAKFPEPESDKTYSASFILSQSLAEDEDYRVVVNYDGNEVELSFDITGKTTGSTGPITVKTDKTSYSSGSTVRISGVIADEIIVPGQQIALQVFNPDKAPYRFDPIDPEDDGSYSYSMTVGGPLGVTGEWDVKVTYNGQVGETSFDLTGGVAPTPGYDLKFEDRTFRIEYESDGAIKSMYVRPAEKKLIVSIDGAEDGKLTINLPREVIDAVQGGADIKYIVTTIDTETGEEKQIDITESLTNAEERTIVIDYDAGTDLIEIQGTNVVPEFGALSAIVLAIAIFSIIAVTAKFSNRFSAFRQR